MRKTISGGERKRTSIGVELITDPSLILLDEPTSGLDSFKALSIVKILRKLAHDKGKTIISTIHQPSSEAFNEFDRLLLMSDGYVVYQGEAKMSAQYFIDLGFSIPTFSNPADTYMRILAMKEYPKSDKDKRKLKYFCHNYRKFVRDNVTQENLAIVLPEPDIKKVEAGKLGGWGQYKLLCARNTNGVKNDPMQSSAKIGQQIWFSLIVTSMFFDLGYHNPGDNEGKIDVKPDEMGTL